MIQDVTSSDIEGLTKSFVPGSFGEFSGSRSLQA